MQLGQVGGGRGKPPEVDLEAEFPSVRLQPDRQVRLGVCPENPAPADRLRVAAAAAAGAGAGMTVAAAQLQPDRFDAVNPLSSDNRGTAREEFPDLFGPLGRC